MTLRTQVTEYANGLWHARTLGAWKSSLTASPHTLRAYTRGIEQFCLWLDDHGLDLLGVERVHVDDYRHTLTGAPATTAQKLAAVSSFYRYAVSAGITTTNPVDFVRRPQVTADHTATQGLTEDQARALLNAARADGPRSHALVSLLLFTGIRLGEALNANTSDYGHDAGHRALILQRRSGTQAKVAVPPPAVDALTAYLGTTGRELVAAADSGPPLFTTATGRRWAPSEAFRTVQRLARLARIEGRISPHNLRHAFASIALNAGTTLHDLQDSMGHADPRTTRRYDRARHDPMNSAGYTVAKALVH